MGRLILNKTKQYGYVLKLIFLMAISLSIYDLTLITLAKIKQHPVQLLNINEPSKSTRIAESYMYLVGINKDSWAGHVYGDNYIQEHKHELTIRPALPPIISRLFFWISWRNLNLSIFLMHLVPPLINVVLLYALAYAMILNKKVATIALLLGMNESLFSFNYYIIKIEQLFSLRFISAHLLPWVNPELSIIEPWRVFLRQGFYYHISEFGRFFSPGMTFFSLLLPLLYATKLISSVQEKEKLAVFFTAGVWSCLSLYCYPHQILIVLIFYACLFLLHRFSRWALGFYFCGLMIGSIPFLWMNYQFMKLNAVSDILTRVGFYLSIKRNVYHLPIMFTFLIVFIFLFKDIKSLINGCIKKTKFSVAEFSSCLSVSLFVSLLGSYFFIWIVARFTHRFFQPWLIPLRVHVYLLPILVCLIFKKQIKPYANTGIVLLGFLYTASHVSAAYLHYPYFERSHDIFKITKNIEQQTKPGSIIMSLYQDEIMALLSSTDRYSYTASGINSTASNDELVERLFIMFHVYHFTIEQVEEEMRGLMTLKDGHKQPFSYDSWIFHHGENWSREKLKNTYQNITQQDRCILLNKFKINYIRSPDRHVFYNPNLLDNLPCLEHTNMNGLYKVK